MLREPGIWNKWLGQKAGFTPNLSRADRTAKNLTGVNFIGVNLFGANLDALYWASSSRRCGGACSRSTGMAMRVELAPLQFNASLSPA
jgi:hypothetical protein